MKTCKICGRTVQGLPRFNYKDLEYNLCFKCYYPQLEQFEELVEVMKGGAIQWIQTN